MLEDLLIRPLEPWDTDEAAGVWWAARHADGSQLPPAIHTEANVRAGYANGRPNCRQRPVSLHSHRIVAVLPLAGDALAQLSVEAPCAGERFGSTRGEPASDLRPGGLALWTFQTNTRAQAFYTRHGFTEVRRTDGSANEEKAPDVRMVWGSHPERLESTV